MLEIRFHGRGGQGAVTAARILANALLCEEKYTLDFPKFGVERRGAPAEVFLRIDEKKILIRSQIYQPDCVVVFDSSLIEGVNATQGLKQGGWLIINSPKGPSEFQRLGNFKIAVIDATKIALNHKIGTDTNPIINTVILGAIIKVLKISLESLKKAIQENKDVKSPEKNIAAAIEAYESVKMGVNDEKN
ncbi:MAG: pyruvate ferredoxin oxidoreductase [Parcubacteria group bacterium CG11_big_fil_rev_8_21_14_0_20_39_14]|nr:MAG: pyruvate ferredoxin oxidoreductase [Parcubacteria group bacterium CG11_big_fil_rev_8_21_14_0_20_39_14]PIS35315.1 MAG: pyruvate ferredoxin oxidoreductase [Parcubacteria group bacterium CG08_land_8_20_14_0_20_38_56]